MAQSELSLSISPTFSVPTGESQDLYDASVGARLFSYLPIREFPIVPTIGFEYSSLILTSDAGNVNAFKPAIGLSARLVNGNRFVAGLSALGGMYAAIFQDNPAAVNPYFQVGAEIGIKFSEAMVLSLEPQYENYITRRNGEITSFYSGLGAALNFSITPSGFGSGERQPRIRIEIPEFQQIYPVIYKYYAANPLGTVRIVNEEPGRITNVTVEFFVPQYMDAPQVIGEFASIDRGDSREIPISALFRNSVLSITESDTAQGQIIVEYDVGASSLSDSRNSPVRIENRNMISWDDDRKAAAFVTARDPSILKLARNVSSAVRDQNALLINDNFTTAMALYGALQEMGLNYVVDPDSSYSELSVDSAADFVQFPVQTLDYRSGDCDDLTVLYCSLLEAAGIESAFVTIPGHIFAAFSLDMTESEASQVFSDLSKLIIIDDQAWLPVEMTIPDEDFMRTWDVAAQQWREALNRDQQGFFPVRQAWSTFEATWFADSENNAVVDRFPSDNAVLANFSRDSDQFRRREVTPLVADLQDAIAQRSSPRLINRLGTIYARYGLYNDAQTQFNRSADMGYVPAIVNLGNISYLRENYDQALNYHEQAYDLNGDSTAAVIGISRVLYEQEKYAEAEDFYSVAVLLDPDIADNFAYIGGDQVSQGRATDVRQRRETSWAD